MITKFIAVFLAATAVAFPQTDTTKKATMQKPAKEIVVMETTMGTIELEVFRSKAPKTVENFVQLAQQGYYDGLTFHRIIDKFMIQGGDPQGTGAGGKSIYGEGFEDEIAPDLKFDRAGLLAMANRGVGTKSNGSQFFITTVPTPWLNNNHTIFGEVVAGMEVVDKIGKVKTVKPADKPVTPVLMTNVYLKGSEKKPKAAAKTEEKK
jgi:cyclophilin family peptidyl-prolyl cis-trans isomerase